MDADEIKRLDELHAKVDRIWDLLYVLGVNMHEMRARQWVNEAFARSMYRTGMALDIREAVARDVIRQLRLPEAEARPPEFTERLHNNARELFDAIGVELPAEPGVH